MKKERSFRPPQVVLDTINHAECDSSITKLDNTAIPLSDLRLMHAFLRSQDIITKRSEEWMGKGGNEGLIWSRRVLRQEGILKASEIGDMFIPAVIDIQLGPNIVVGFTKQDPTNIIAELERTSTPASLIPADSGTYVFMSGKAEVEYKVEKGIPGLPDTQLGDITMVDESRNKLTSIFKAAGEGVTGVRCEKLSVEGQMPVTDIEWDETHFIQTIDSPGRQAKILKVDDELGLVLGWAIISTIEEQPYFDKQGDYIPDHGMLDAATDFMLSSRVAKEMHVGDEKGTVVFAWPMTAEIAKAFDIEVHQTGLMIAMKPDNEEMLEKFRDGTYNGFSIGGKRLKDHTEEVD